MKPHGEIIGPLGHAFGLSGELKFSQPSTIKFKYPKCVDGNNTPFYDDLTKDKLVQLDPIGVFVVRSSEETGNGIRTVKDVKLQSREYQLSGKQSVFAAGTYNLWNPADQENTLLGMVLANSRSWSVGYVSPTLIGRYRTFDDIDQATLSFLQDTVQETYDCVFVFDTYNMTVSAYDASEEPEMLPIYLSYQNLLKEGIIRSIDDTIITKLYVQGAEGVDIRNVNPTGDNYIYNLNWHIENGDIPAALAAKWRTWQNSILLSRNTTLRL